MTRKRSARCDGGTHFDRRCGMQRRRFNRVELLREGWSPECGTGSAVPAASPSVVDASVVPGGWAHYDYDPAPAVDALANEEPSVTVG